MKTSSLLLALTLLLIPALASAIVARDYRSTFDEHRAEVLTCAAGATGSFVLRMHVLPDGTTEAVRVESASSAQTSRAGRCVARALRSWHFARSSSGAFPRYRVELAADSFSITRLPYRAE